ncbi:glycoside hydrolase family 47 protein [Viridothelium virens]|uniref:alpha-1,2-Mannosidase n=1 Tax=Viridothelium virens TaxID=1048519 RepID=A0A6A6HPJ2_VIRVR|nr:glycoside hydrolase family 47 protein [Viridothelium virens]
MATMFRFRRYRAFLMFTVISFLAIWQLIKYRNLDTSSLGTSLGIQNPLPPSVNNAPGAPPVKPIEPAKEGKPLDVNLAGANRDPKAQLPKLPAVPEAKRPTQDLKEGEVEEKPNSSPSKEEAGSFKDTSPKEEKKVPPKAASPKRPADTSGDTVLAIPAAQDEVPLKPVAAGGQGRLEVDPWPSDAPKVYWTKQKEHFPVTTTIQLPTGAPKAVPTVQFAFKTEKEKAKEEREKKRDIIKKSFLKSWNSYKEYAWMHDELSPVSGDYRDPFAGWGATLVDTLDTLWMMGLKEEFEDGVKAVAKIDFTTSPRKDIPLFETVIRYLGGLIAAYDISGAKYGTLLDKSVELADILMGAFDTPNRMPLTFYHWMPSFASQPHRADTKATLAELGSLSIEFTRLAQLTKESKYYDAVARITDALEKWQPDTRLPGLWPSDVDASGCKKPKSKSAINSKKPKGGKIDTKLISEDSLVGGSEKATNLKEYDEDKVIKTFNEALKNPEAFKDTKKTEKPQEMVQMEKPKALVFDPDAESGTEPAKGGSNGLVPGKAKIKGWDDPIDETKKEDSGSGKAKVTIDDPLGENKMKEMGKSLAGQIQKRAAIEPQKSKEDEKSTKEEDKAASADEKTSEETEKQNEEGKLKKADGKFKEETEKPKKTDEKSEKEDEAAKKVDRFLSPERLMAMEKEARSSEDEKEEQEDRGLNSYDADDLCTPQGLAPAPDSRCDEYTLGGRADSVYEYLPKQWLLLGGLKDQYKKMYDMAIDAINKHLVFRPMIRDEKRDLRIAGSYTTCDAVGGGLKPDSQHLTCFAGAMLGLGSRIYPDSRKADLDLARKITDGCVWAYEVTTTGIMPEAFLALPCDDMKSCKWNESHWHHMIDPHPEWREQAASRLELPFDAKHLPSDAHVDSKVGGKVDVGRTKAALDAPQLAREAEEGGRLHQKRQLGENLDEYRKSLGIDRVDNNVKMPAPLDHEEYARMRIEDERLPPGMSSIPSKKYILRPEAIESVFYMYRLTGEEYWREKGWKMFTAIQAYTSTELGNSAIDDVTKRVPKPRDEMESFWLAETLKYFYLLFSEPSLVNLDEWVLNTEAHPFRRPQPPKQDKKEEAH